MADSSTPRLLLYVYNEWSLVLRMTDSEAVARGGPSGCVNLQTSHQNLSIQVLLTTETQSTGNIANK